MRQRSSSHKFCQDQSSFSSDVCLFVGKLLQCFRNAVKVARVPLHIDDSRLDSLTHTKSTFGQRFLVGDDKCTELRKRRRKERWKVLGTSSPKCKTRIRRDKVTNLFQFLLRGHLRGQWLDETLQTLSLRG